MRKVLLFGLLVLAGCSGGSEYRRAAPGALPPDLPNLDIQNSPYFASLKRDYGKGLAYEQAKIRYLFGLTLESKYLFDRNGQVYNSEKTVRHLRRKYTHRINRILTAQEFIDEVASISNTSGKPYLVVPGDGLAYQSRDVLNYELKRLEAFMDNYMKNKGSGSAVKETPPGKIEIYNSKKGKTEKVEPVIKSDAEWKKILTREQYGIMRRKGTEVPFTKTCAIPKSGKGIYQCAACGTDLFAYGTKYESRTGWPSFFEPVSALNVKLEEDSTFGMRRTEVSCARCGSHLGHVFDDGPPPTGKRYCINTVSLKLSEY